MLEQVKPHGATPRNGFQVRCCFSLLVDINVYNLKTIFKELHLIIEVRSVSAWRNFILHFPGFSFTTPAMLTVFPPVTTLCFMFYLVGALQDGSTDITSPTNDTEIDSAINGILETFHKGSATRAAPAGEGEAGSVKKTRRRSLMWQHFKRLESLSMAQCQLCMKKLQCFESGCTSNLHRHMSKRHPQVFSKTTSNQRQHPTRNSNSLKTITLRRHNEMMPGTIYCSFRNYSTFCNISGFKHKVKKFKFNKWDTIVKSNKIYWIF